MGIYVGFDPGGSGAFGWAVVSGEAFPLRLVDRGIAHHAHGAFNTAMDCAGSKVNAVGIDAPLFWNPAGDRRADQMVRKAIMQLGSPSATVNSVNSLQGACLIQGILVAMMCQQKTAKGIPITEAHPKALLWLVGKATCNCPPVDIAMSDLNEYVVGSRVQGASDHERDAVLGAVAAFAMESRLMEWRDLYGLEPDSITPLNPPPGYWMPLCPDLRQPASAR
jgi:predicted nuclease with RNAse H fold